MLKFLITGARAPVALELARNFNKYGHTVILADSLRYPIAKKSCAIKRFYTIASPKNNIEAFKQSLENVIQQENIDYLIPTCEEVFYVAFIKSELSKLCHVFCPGFELIRQLHSKLDILQLASHTNVRLPRTYVADKDALLERRHFNNVVIKQEYSRFGEGVYINPTAKQCKALMLYAGGKILVQEKIQGTEYCAYAIAVNGIVYAHAIYEPIYRVNASAGIYFEPVENILILDFMKNFCTHHGYTGQISFDVMVNNSGVYLLECNPRSTSGLHLLQNQDIAGAVTQQCTIDHMKAKPKMIYLAMLVIALPFSIVNKQLRPWRNNFHLADDVVNVGEDRCGFFYQCISFLELVLISLGFG